MFINMYFYRERYGEREEKGGRWVLGKPQAQSVVVPVVGGLWLFERSLAGRVGGREEGALGPGLLWGREGISYEKDDCILCQL